MRLAGGWDYFTERSGTELGSKIRNGTYTERNVYGPAVYMVVQAHEQQRPTFVNVGAGGAEVDW